MKIIPMNDKVVVERREPDQTTNGGIVLPEMAQKSSTAEGRVLSVGQGIVDAHGQLHAFQVKEGDRVLFAPYAGTEFQLDGHTLLILRESDILAILT